MLVGLPRGFLLGLVSRPLILPLLLVGGEVPGPCELTGDRIGLGERFIPMLDSDVRPARWMLSLLSAGPTWLDCSA